MAKLKDIIGGDEQTPLDVDRDGKQLYPDNIVHFVRTELEKRKTDRRPFELRWTLNANFLAGNQFCDINVHRDDIEQYQPLFDWQEHNSFNRIAPISDTRLANLGVVTYAMTVLPRTDELDDIEKAMVSTELLRYTQQTNNFNHKISQATAWSELTGTAFWLTWWDKDAGEEIANITIMSDDGIAKEQVVYEGDLKFGLLTPYEVYPEDIYKQDVSDQRSIILEQNMTVDEIYDLYGIDVDGRTIDTFALMPIPAGGGAGYETSSISYQTKQLEDAECVVTYFERPSKRYPHGRIAIIIGDTLVYYGALPYSRIPIVSQKCKNVPGIFFGMSYIETLIPLQRAYNGAKNKLHDYIKTVASNTLIGEEGSIDIDEYIANGTSPGSFLPYQRGFDRPIPLDNKPIPVSVINEIQQLANDMEYASGVSQLMVTGNAPVGVKSGRALERVQNIDQTRMSLAAENIRSTVRELAVLWLEVYKSCVNGHRVINIVGSNDAGAVLTWCSDDINSYDVKYDTKNELLLSEEQQEQKFLLAYNMGLFADENGIIDRRIKERALEMLKIGDYTDLLGESEQHKQNARRENSYYEKGVIPQVFELDDHQIHIDEHRRYALSMRFHLLLRKNPEYAEQYLSHIDAHKREIANIDAIINQKMMAAQQMQAVQNAQQQQKTGQPSITSMSGEDSDEITG